jgi:hypothetical protein
VSQRCGTLFLVRNALRALPIALLVLAAASPAARGAVKVITSTAPAVSTQPQPAPSGSAFGPLQPLSTGPTTTETQINSKRPDQGGLNQGTLLLLVGVSFALIIGVGVLIWYEGRTRRATAKKRRQRMRSGRTPQPEVAAAGRRGPPPPPRKRQAARRKKR